MKLLALVVLLLYPHNIDYSNSHMLDGCYSQILNNSTKKYLKSIVLHLYITLHNRINNVELIS